MSFRLSRPGSAGQADNEPAETDPAATAGIPGPRGADTADTSDTANGDTADQNVPDAATGRPQPSFQPKGAAEPVGTPASAGPPDDTPLEGPLLPDAAQLRENWQRILSSFIDDPRGSVAEAAALVDHAAQALAGALQQRQRRLRESWDTADGATRSSPLDTEELRVAMQRYRTLFNHICKP